MATVIGMRPLLLVLILASLALVACGGESSGDDDPRGTSFDAAIRDARAVRARDFPAADGRTLQEIAADLPAINVGLATSVYTPGANRLAFGLIDERRRFVYGKTAVYLARSPGGKAIGPFAAPADPLVVKPPFRSQGAAQAGGDIAAVYQARVRIPRPGRWYVLGMTRSRGRTYGGAAQIQVRRSTAIPSEGEPAPRVATDTVASARGDIESIETRVPPDDMHERSFRDVVGRKPVALLFATPRLCQSRVCGPVVDIAAQLKAEYGERVEFIHQEVYVDNDLDQGLRPPMRAFGVRTEPWLFTVDREGRVAARLEGSFGNEGFREAVEAAL